MTIPPEKSKGDPMHGAGSSDSAGGQPLPRPISRVERLVPLYFGLEGDTSVVSEDAAGLSRIRSAEGIAWRADSSRLCFEVPERRAALNHNLPATIDLSPLLGHSLRVTLVEETSPGGVPSQTLTLCGALGRVWLIARLGPVRGVVHAIGGAEVHAALSQRLDGPLVVGTRELQGLVNPGGHVHLPGSRGAIVVQLVARVSSDTAAYVLAEDGIFTG
jgi:hypothetical protein